MHRRRRRINRGRIQLHEDENNAGEDEKNPRSPQHPGPYVLQTRVATARRMNAEGRHISPHGGKGSADGDRQGHPTPIGETEIHPDDRNRDQEEDENARSAIHR